MPHSPPDIIFHSGRITTLNKGQPVAQAVANAAAAASQAAAPGTDIRFCAIDDPGCEACQ